MTKPKIEEKKISDLVPDGLNINAHTQRGRGIVEHSIRRYGIGRGIVAAGKGTDTPQIIGGNLTHEVVGSLDIDDVIFVHSNGEKLVVTVRDDIAPGSAEAVALGLIDNEAQKQSYNVDIDILAQVMADPSVKLLAEQDKMFGDLAKGMGEGDDTYSRKVETPIYEIKGDKPKIIELFNDERYRKLLLEIDSANISDEQKDFLRIAATRHIIFDFSKIAEYYAHSDKVLQGLMENNALVIIDFNKAIELGYVKLSEELKKQFAKEYPDE